MFPVPSEFAPSLQYLSKCATASAAKENDPEYQTLIASYGTPEAVDSLVRLQVHPLTKDEALSGNNEDATESDLPIIEAASPQPVGTQSEDQTVYDADVAPAVSKLQQTILRFHSTEIEVGLAEERILEARINLAKQEMKGMVAKRSLLVIRNDIAQQVRDGRQKLKDIEEAEVRAKTTKRQYLELQGVKQLILEKAGGENADPARLQQFLLVGEVFARAARVSKETDHSEANREGGVDVAAMVDEDEESCQHLSSTISEGAEGEDGLAEVALSKDRTATENYGPSAEAGPSSLTPLIAGWDIVNCAYIIHRRVYC
ncbi:hypothetical protein MIND_00766200 [Mycena indigotica]|uniref:Uncharacterized protein n=1 Tax=Mycena indigotica TaxID=2126181 RepID=A0A8H6SLK6_9AGAR|nr:uncharacterized protein MIND_00766200 [Mycena indigotica]KAF7302000.1 hypothetical protein MIND_00766200 [Mycena indigotica]